ncbi:MAG: RNA ligase family protein [Candidatus Binataceae bacterium]
MSEEFVKFPRTPHLAWLGKFPPRQDKVLEESEAKNFLKGRIVVEEKIDGSNVGVSVDPVTGLRVQNRGGFLFPGSHPQFGPLWAWLDNRRGALMHSLGDNLVLFGEWSFAVHSVRYSRLPDWFLAFDIFDRSKGWFWSTTLRDQWLARMGIACVPQIARGRFSLAELTKLVEGVSRVGEERMEGLYLRSNAVNEERLHSRAKLVRADFAERIEEHWSAKFLQTNRLVRSSSPVEKTKSDLHKER